MQFESALSTLIAGRDLDRSVIESLFGELMDGKLSEAQKAALLVALAAKGESSEEIAGAALAMRSRCIVVPHTLDDVVDTCGTGGDASGTFNVSTAAALVAAGGGARVAKHGNRSVSSRSGSADVLSALGVSLDLDPEQTAHCLEEVGIAFLFAPRLHPAMREVVPVRKELGVRTIFNVLGPLTNPAGASRQLMGVYSAELVAPVARVLLELGSRHALVVHGDGLDEISTAGDTTVAEVAGDDVQLYTLAPEVFGLERRTLEDLAGGEPEENARLMVKVLEGEGGPLEDVTVLNAAAALYVGGVASSIVDGLERARESVRSGAARETLSKLQEFSA